MRIHKLEIRNIRGIKELYLEPKGKNFLISGPNGTGKSSVVDSLDFLLTGDMSRLNGTGTRGVTVKKYGSHLDSQDNPEDCYVSAEISLDDKNVFIIKRSQNDPTHLELSSEDYRTRLDTILALAKEKQHILTRREILSFIATQPLDRAQRIQSLLNVTRIEEIRQSLVKSKNYLKKEFETHEKICDNEKLQVAAIVQNPNFDTNILLEFINSQRAILGSDPIQTIDVTTTNIKIGVKYDNERRKQKDNNESASNELTNLRNFRQHQSEELRHLDNSLRKILTALASNPELARALEQYELTELGLVLLDDSGECPLCEAKWEAVELRTKLETRLQLGEQAKKYNSDIEDLAKRIRNIIGFLYASLRPVVAIASQMNFSQENLLSNWLKEVVAFQNSVSNARTEYMQYESEHLIQGFISPQISDALAAFELEIQVRSELISPEQISYDNLVKLEDAIRNWQNAEVQFKEAEKAYEIAQGLFSAFIAARDSVLNELYDQIKERFEEIYRRLHFEDEGGFSAALTPSDTGLSLEVGFYDRGKHSPLALHSEGHQDSMGLCLFLALAEKIARNQMNVMILDDVVMSVDADHRKNLCKVLDELFKDFQIIIATHDKTWHHQLRSQGVVKKGETIEFLGWHITSGPRINKKIDVWETINEDLNNNEVPAAAHKLRRWSEMYFAEVCERLGAKVVFRQDSGWDFGDLFHPAISTWKELNRKAANAAHTWGQTEKHKELLDKDNEFSRIVVRTQSEQWIINRSIHYNRWLEQLSKQDFNDVTIVFRDLVTYFECASCGSMIEVDNPQNPTSVRCSCTKVNWNLRAKDKQK